MLLADKSSTEIWWSKADVEVGRLAILAFMTFPGIGIAP
ncbi:hypothetical protein B6N60_01771 [Richelia sinica FACHB-800]|uniref:Uncharacterized protein n=1 Tax=Richelia sinica FACHB-800 TaxID=1357546 RepID=A0A975Y4E6_9NOST|nr:hypothetical protein B6N60_01771 [Richelia sinica FACHB-800]